LVSSAPLILEWRGFYLDGRTAARQPARVQISAAGLTFTLDDGSNHFWPYEQIRQTQGFYAGEQVRFEKSGESPEALLLSDTDFLRTLHKIVPGVSRRFHQPESRGLRRSLTAFAALGAVLLGAGLYLWAIPAAARIAAARVPVSWEESLGESVVEQLAPADNRCTDPEVNRIVSNLTARLSAAASSPYTFRVAVVRAPVVNAFAAPGGQVVVFQGLIEQTRRPEELGGVLAHEFEHIIQKHTTRMLFQHTTAGLMLSALTGDVTGISAFGAGAAHTLGTLSYNRAMEQEADVEGIKLLAAAGIDPSAMIDFFETLKKKSGETSEALAYLSSHPAPAQRIATLRSMRLRVKPARPLLSSKKWEELKMKCRPAAPKR
jgi:predicted Zn-dependent protease